jgi:alpha-L-rhamnosidase
VKLAWLNRYLTHGGLIIGQTQTAYVLALHLNLLPEELRPTVLNALVRDIQKRGMHLSTGFVGTPYLNHVLTNFGRTDVAYALLMQKTFPSWLYPITQGATTIWERWDGWTHDKGFSDTGMNSFNHYAYGAVGDWMYTTVAGIDIDPDQPAYKHIIIRPQPGGGLTHARAALNSMYGLIESAWRIESGDTLRVALTIPANTAALLRLPSADAGNVIEGGRPVSAAEGVTLLAASSSGADFAIGAGRYSFSTRLPRQQ